MTGPEREPTLAELRQAYLDAVRDNEHEHVQVAWNTLRQAIVAEWEYLANPDPDDFGRPCPHTVVEFGECTECGETV